MISKASNWIRIIFQFCQKVNDHTLVGISLGEWLPVVKYHFRTYLFLAMHG